MWYAHTFICRDNALSSLRRSLTIVGQRTAQELFDDDDLLNQFYTCISSVPCTLDFALPGVHGASALTPPATPDWDSRADDLTPPATPDWDDEDSPF